MIKRHGKNVHEIMVDGNKFALLSDLHWDNPKCDRKLLKKHLDYCKEEGIKVFVNGDFFCLMGGRGDPRRSKSEIRPELNNDRYLDSVVETAVEWFSPYADILTVIGYGNHETKIVKFQESDVLQRFVDLLNLKCHSNVQTGGYGGWLILQMKFHSKYFPVKIKYFHGSGGGGIVTKGAINLTRALELYEGCDIFTMGHIHENWARNDVRDSLGHNAHRGYFVKHKPIHLAITGTYKEEYGDGSKGWHIERGAPVKAIGGRMLQVTIERDRENGQDRTQKYIDTHRIF